MAEPKKKKPTGGKHVKKRKPVLLPEAWDVVAQDLATAASQPKMWYIVTLLKAAAEARGMANLPKPPWDKSKDDPK